MRPTSIRREVLMKKWFFRCQCSRCQDPTELGSHINGVTCPACKDGILVPDDDSITWQCPQCPKSVTGRAVESLLETFLERLPGGKSIRELEDFLQLCSRCFHPNNFLCILAKRMLIQLYNRDNSQLMKKKLSYCEDLLKFYEILDSGFSQTRGLTLIEKVKAIVQLKDQDFNIDIKPLIQEIDQCLYCETENSKAGQHYAQFLDWLKQHNLVLIEL